LEDLDASIFSLEAARSSEMLVSCHTTTWCNNPGGCDLNLDCYEYLRSCKSYLFYFYVLQKKCWKTALCSARKNLTQQVVTMTKQGTIYDGVKWNEGKAPSTLKPDTR